MRQRTLGRTGIRVGEIGMGCEGFVGKSAEACANMVDQAMAAGINCFDMYTSDPLVRKQVGEALSRYPRDSYVVQGHLCTIWKDGQYCRTRKMDEVRIGFEQLLASMRLDYVDIGMIHFVDTPEDFDTVIHGPVYDYACQLKQQHIIGHIGLSTHNTDIAMKAVEQGQIDVIMFSVNPAYDMMPPIDDIEVFFQDHVFERVYEGIDPKRARLYEACQNAGVALTVMKPYAGGLLLDPLQSPFGQALTPIQCVSYCLDRPAVASVMVGAADIEQMMAAVAYEQADDAAKDYSSVLAHTPNHAFHGHCMYCGHCAPCTSHIPIAQVHRYLDLALAQGQVTETLRDHYQLLAHHAGECIACGQCMSRCPFEVDIIEKMKQAEKLFNL